MWKNIITQVIPLEFLGHMYGFKWTARSGSMILCQLHLATGFADLLALPPPPPQVVLFYLPHFSASCLCRHQINTKIAELWVHWILSCECNKRRWLEKVSMQSVAPLCSQDLRQMQEKQKRIEKDSACWKSRVNSLYWIINMMRFTILILHTCQQAYDFPVNFLQAKKIQVDFCQWCC